MATRAGKRKNTAASAFTSFRPLQSLYKLTAPLLRAAVSNGEVESSVPKHARQPIGVPFGCGIVGTVMVDSDLAFILIPLVPALAFMLWVIWGLEKQIRSGRRHRDAITRPKG